LIHKLKNPHQNFIVPLSNANQDPAEWNVMYVNAHRVWQLGFNGTGMFLATADTGTLFTHEALLPNYRGNKNGNIDHNFNWFDPTANSRVPIDRNGHGTHVMATAAGSGPRKVGVAPGSKWLSCKALAGETKAIGKISWSARCNQFFLAPTNLNGTNPNPDLRPHVSSHSYFCTNCGMEQSIIALRKAGSIFVKSCGNQGPRCNSITEPGFYKEAVCAGALQTKSEVIASFSSRGPGRNNTIKPDFSCPGAEVNSAHNRANNSYTAMSGTSMAAPCLNGGFGLFWSAVRSLERNIDKTLEFFAKSSKHQTSNDCSSNGSPNNVYGYGTIDILKAVQMANGEGYH